MARMMSEEETALVKGFTEIKCGNCPLKEGCKLQEMDHGCRLTKDYFWEVVYGFRCDSKYGRKAINKDRRWKRSVTFQEFYGGAVVD